MRNVIVSRCLDYVIRGYIKQILQRYEALINQEEDPVNKEILMQHHEHYKKAYRNEKDKRPNKY